MNNFVLAATAQTPRIDFNSITGIMSIEGRCIPDEPDDFWLTILNWFESYLQRPLKSTVIKIDLEYFNIASSKRILFLLYKLNELLESGCNVIVEWRYKIDDEEMFEVGQDFAYMVKFPFEFISYRDGGFSLAI